MFSFWAALAGQIRQPASQAIKLNNSNIYNNNNSNKRASDSFASFKLPQPQTELELPLVLKFTFEHSKSRVGIRATVTSCSSSSSRSSSSACPLPSSSSSLAFHGHRHHGQWQRCQRQWPRYIVSNTLYVVWRGSGLRFGVAIGVASGFAMPLSGAGGGQTANHCQACLFCSSSWPCYCWFYSALGRLQFHFHSALFWFCPMTCSSQPFLCPSFCFFLPRFVFFFVHKFNSIWAGNTWERDLSLGLPFDVTVVYF